MNDYGPAATAYWNGYGWVYPTTGRARIRKDVRPYGGRWVDVVSIDGDDVMVFIYPVERRYRLDEFDRFDTTLYKES